MNGVKLDINHASTIDEVYGCLHELEQRDNALQQRLDSLLQEKTLIHRELQRLDLLQANLAAQQVTSRNLLSDISSASSVASAIFEQVAALDGEQNKVKDCLATVEGVSELKRCVLGVHWSMEDQDWEQAAFYIGRSRKLDEHILLGKFAKNVVPTSEVPEPPDVMLNQAAESLCGLFVREFEKATQAKDVDKLTRYFKLFPLIGKETEGLDMYARFVCSMVATKARSLISGKLEGNMIYGTLIARLFEHIAAIIDQHSKLVDRHYGKGKMLRVVEKLVGEADRQGGIIIDTWWDERQMARKLNELRSYAFSFLVQSFLPGRSATPRSMSPAASRRTSEDEGIDVKEVDSLLNEMNSILTRWSLFSVFLARMWQSEGEPLRIPIVVLNSHLANKLALRVLPAFEASLTFFFRRSVEKAFQLSEFPDPSTSQHPLISSSVDDTMYILQKSLRQTLSCGQYGVSSNLISNIRRVMEGDFTGLIQRRLRDEFYPKQLIPGMPINPAEQARAETFMVLLNDLSVSAEYVRRIIQELLPPLGRMFPIQEEESKVKSQLEAFLASIEKRTGELVSEGVTIVFTNLVKPKLRPFLNQTIRDSYVIMRRPEERDRSLMESGWKEVIATPKRVLCGDNLDKLLSQSVGTVARLLEKRMWALGGKVNELGAISLERDVAILSAVITGGQYALREKMERCTQIATALNVDGEHEFDEGDWKVPREELVNARRMRLD